MLTGSGAEVRTCPSAAEGLEALRKWRPDVLVSDIEMPGEETRRPPSNCVMLGRLIGRRLKRPSLSDVIPGALPRFRDVGHPRGRWQERHGPRLEHDRWPPAAAGDPVQVIAFARPRSSEWRWRIVDYGGQTVEESFSAFATIGEAVAAGGLRLREIDAPPRPVAHAPTPYGRRR